MIICVTAYENISVLALRKAIGNEQGIRILQRIDIGMVFPVIAMAIAALVERKRLREVEREIVRVERVGYLSMSVFWLAPQFIILGIGDGFTFVGLQEYFYDQEILVVHQTSTDTASNDDSDNDKYDTSRENGDSSAKVEEEPKCHEVAHNSGHSNNKESNGAMVKRESEVVVVAQA
ncbi:Protein NRT1/ PTR FAMILY 5.7 [Camellia lanceoleosa]|uniref:Protein NRT1/ PTR FAMILY 5.7 n=1 Tax=Camellia lanceoleosa TaxID=1840588 RepID=A0ACC0I1W7_9ERIC|nr:Protein NRT1/ PTR FAMILY 5.7 [Camellia lanceoleosa]